MQRAALFIACALFAGGACAFDLKGISPGAEATPELTKDCAAVPIADSGIPGFRCATTLGGDQADMRLVVFEGKVIAIVIYVKQAQMRPVLQALTDKFGNREKSNRYIENYSWLTPSDQRAIRYSGRLLR